MDTIPETYKIPHIFYIKTDGSKETDSFTFLNVLIPLYFFKSSVLVCIWCWPLPMSKQGDVKKQGEHLELWNSDGFRVSEEIIFLPEYPKEMLEIGLK